VLMAFPSRVATRLGARSLAGAAVLSVVLAFSPTITVANSAGTSAYLGYETPALVSGSYARVATDDGAGLILRAGPSQGAEPIDTLANGDVVQVLDGPSYDDDGNGWFLVTDGASTAYAYGGFLTEDVELTASSAKSSSGYLGYDTPAFSAGQAVTVVTDDGQGLSIRTGPSTGAEKIATLGDGDVVTIVDGPVYDGASNGWYLISDGSFQGYGFAGFLASNGSAASSSTSGTATSGSTPAGNLGLETPSFAAGATATVQTDDGGGLNIRSGPSVESEAVLSVADGGSVTIINGPYFDDAQNGWYAVSSGDVSGFVYAGYLAGGSAPVDGAASTNGATSSGYLGYDTPAFSQGQQVQVLTDDGGGLRVRAEAATNGEQLATLGDGDIVTIVDGPWYDASNNGWYLISDGAMEGYVFAGFLTTNGAISSNTSSSSSSATTTPVPSGEARFDAGDDVQASQSVNLRSGASISSSRNGTLTTGMTVEVVDGPFYDADGDDWSFIVGDDLSGFAMGEFLELATSAANSNAASAKMFVYPVKGYTFTQAFGCSPYAFEPYNSSLGCNYHNGIDLAAPSYTPIVAAAAGTVTAAGWCDCGLGYYVTIDHGNGYKTTYGHMAEQPYVAVGQTVSQGETIGPIGSTGLSTGPHVHFVIEQNGVDIDPMTVL
jgi:murein DD-endopeptidase MepM/ murein hydrolase activator NlpD